MKSLCAFILGEETMNCAQYAAIVIFLGVVLGELVTLLLIMLQEVMDIWFRKKK